MIHDERGGVMVEALVSLPVIVFMFFAMYMLSLLFAGHLIVLRAADAAARAAIVFLPDNPAYYGEGQAEKDDSVRAAAGLALLSSPYLSLADVHWNQAQGFDPLTAEVSAEFDCSSFPTALLCGADRKIRLQAAATLPYQGGFPDR